MSETGSKRRRYTIKEVRASQDLVRASIPFLMRYVFVPIAWPLTVSAGLLRISPNTATGVRGLMAIGGLVLIAFPVAPLFWSGLVLFVLAVIADSVDGNLCRLQDRASYFGKYFDGLVDMTADLGFPLALGIHVWLSNAAEASGLVAAAAAVFCLASIFVLVHRLPIFELIIEKERGETGIRAARMAQPHVNDFLASSLGRALLTFDKHGMNMVFDLRYIMLAVALAVGEISSYLTALAVLYGLTAFLFAVSRTLRGYAALDLHRRSRSAA